MRLQDLVEAVDPKAKEFEAWLVTQNYNYRNRKVIRAVWKDEMAQPADEIFDVIVLQPQTLTPFKQPSFVKPESWKEYTRVDLIDYDLKTCENIPIPKITLSITDCKIGSLKGIEAQICKNIILGISPKNKIGLLRLLKMPALKDIELFDMASSLPRELEKIMMKHLKGERNILECQNELIDAGLEEYARL